MAERFGADWPAVEAELHKWINPDQVNWIQPVPEPWEEIEPMLADLVDQEIDRQRRHLARLILPKIGTRFPDPLTAQSLAASPYLDLRMSAEDIDDATLARVQEAAGPTLKILNAAHDHFVDVPYRDACMKALRLGRIRTSHYFFIPPIEDLQTHPADIGRARWHHLLFKHRGWIIAIVLYKDEHPDLEHEARRVLDLTLQFHELVRRAIKG